MTGEAHRQADPTEGRLLEIQNKRSLDLYELGIRLQTNARKQAPIVLHQRRHHRKNHLFYCKNRDHFFHKIKRAKTLYRA